MILKHLPIPSLCIDTISLTVAGVTVVTSNMSHHCPLNPKMASEGIIETIDQALKKAGIAVGDLKSLLVIKGPGSFTGLRVGLSVANQFAHQLKIPILGLKTDEWWHFRSNDAEAVYLQSMNRAELYFSDKNGAKLIPIEELSILPSTRWLGELKFDHSERLPTHFVELKELDSIEDTWQKALETLADELVPTNSYELVEPFYGKDAKITKAKKSMGLGG